MSTNSSGNSRLAKAVAGPVAHPDRYRKQFWAAGGIVVLAVLVYWLLGFVALVLLAVAGGVATHYALKSGRNRRQKELR
jgi:Flp pilus assembly protein TadB